MPAATDTPADRLKGAINDTPGMSIRKLSRLMHERRPDVDAESYRRSIGKWLAGEGIANGSARLLADVLGKPADYFTATKVTPALLLTAVQELRAEVAELRERLDAVERR